MNTSRAPSRSSRSSGRGFTLLETVLSISIGMLILAAALSLFIVMQRAQQAVFNRADANSEIARIQRTMQRTFSNLMVLPAQSVDNQTGDNQTGDNGADDAALAETEAADLAEPDATHDEPPPPPSDPGPRLALTIDPRFPGQNIQRLEVVLSAAPIPADPVHSAQNAWADEALSLDSPNDGTPGLRGAFILTEPVRSLDTALAASGTLEPPSLINTSRLEATTLGTGWTLWWIPQHGDRVQVATGLRKLNWIVARSENGIIERLHEYEATITTDLPDFMEVEIETTTGIKTSLMFEISWSIGEEPETPDDNAADPANDEGTDEGDQPAGTGTTNRRPQIPGGGAMPATPRLAPSRSGGGNA